MSRRSKERREARRAKQRQRWPEAHGQRKARDATGTAGLGHRQSGNVKTVRRGVGSTTAVKP